MTPLDNQSSLPWFTITPDNEDHEYNETLFCFYRCGNVAAILELDENLTQRFIIFESAPQVCRN